MTLLAAMVPMLLAGLAGSLHCIGMCGPLLLGFTELGAGPAQAGAGGRPAALSWYHLGRIWTYTLLGVVAGALGRSATLVAGVHGWQRPAGIALAAVAIAGGIALLAWGRGRGTGAALPACLGASSGRLAFVGALARTPGRLARLLLGAVMGFLPCGLVYAALVVAAALGGPLEGALGMAAFGLGTVPALTGAIVLLRSLPVRWRAQGTRIAAAVVIATGGWMLYRAVVVVPAPGGCPACAEPSLAPAKR